MASRISVRQASQAIRSNRYHLQPSRIQNYSSQSLYRAPLAPRLRSFPYRSSTHFVQQTRNLSLWGSSSPKPETTTEAASVSNASNFDSSQFESIRTVKATDTSSDFSHTSHSLEPQFIEDVQQAIAQPHGTEVPHTPLEQIPERIGYLYEVCGIDFGYGPSSVVQWVFEHIHILGGYSWTTSIVLLTVGLRAILFPLLVESARQGTNLKLMTTAIKPLQQKMTEAKENNDMMKVSEYSSQMRAMSKVYNVKFSRLFLPMLVQFPLGFAAWRNLRNCATLPVPGFVTESWLWNIDLTFSDVYYVVPAASAVLIWMSLKINAKTAAGTGTGAMGNQDAMKLIKNFLPAISFLFVAFQPGAVQLYFLGSSAMGLLTTWTLSLNAVRTFFGLSTAAQPTGGLPDQEVPTVGTFMRKRSDVVDVSARTVSSANGETSKEAANRNVSLIDRKLGEFKSTWKGAFSGILDKTKGQVQAKGDLKESYRLRKVMEEERRERNARFGGQQEKKKR